ncbi:MAG: V4R domain-containing protein [Candidatus Fimivivens sp.]|nr:V4R domain-containing protein [Candidatus Fimivivens sp.]
MKNQTELNCFSWKRLGDIGLGRNSLGSDMPVIIYRLFAYALRDVLTNEYDEITAPTLFRKAGYLAGVEFANNMLDLSGDFDFFIANLSNKLREFKIGYLQVEKADIKSLSFVFTISEDLDCSGLPITGETVCEYDEGFISGILETYSGQKFSVKEVDCWATGGRLCRFNAHSQQE